MFTLDAVFAAVFLTISAVVLFQQLPEPETDFYTERMASDIVNVLSHTRITDVCTIEGACGCPQYPKLEQVVCSGLVQDTDASLLELFSEVILTGAASGKEIEDVIHEIFAAKNVIDEQRFGFALLYTTPGSSAPLELYNTETYQP